MKRLFCVLAVLFVFGLGKSIACESCYLPGDTDPAGNVLTKSKCWDENKGPNELCHENNAGTGCTMSDTTVGACPITSDSGGTGGGTGSGGDGTNCKRYLSGMCPEDCTSCVPYI
jgi:hypothetical protein